MELDNVERAIDQLTLHKLKYSRDLLREKNLPHTGDRGKLRERLRKGRAENTIHSEDIVALSNELQLWGNQRLRLLRLDPDEVSRLRDANYVQRALNSQGQAHIWNAPIPDAFPDIIVPANVRYTADAPRIQLIATKTRMVRVRVPEVQADEYVQQRYPGVIIQAYREEPQEVLSFAEVCLSDGLTMLSTTLFNQKQRYDDEFDEFLEVFGWLVDPRKLSRMSLYTAVRKIRQTEASSTRLILQQARTAAGTVVGCRSSSTKSDIRSDPDALESLERLGADSGVHCNCYWDPHEELSEVVHTQVYAPDAEITIFGQVREASARNVLRRIIQANQ